MEPVHPDDQTALSTRDKIILSELGKMRQMPLLSGIRQWVRKLSGSRLDGNFRIRGLWNVQCNFQPFPNERKFVYDIMVAQTTGQGACYYDTAPLSSNVLTEMVGSIYDFDRPLPPALDIALLDSIAASFPTLPSLSHTLHGTSSAKSAQRAAIITQEVARLGCSSTNTKIRVSNIGTVSTIACCLQSAGFSVACADLDPSLVGTSLEGGVKVVGGEETLDIVADSDVAVVTGMTLLTNTLDDILGTAKQHQTSVLLFAETGSAFAPYYVDVGIAAVVSEPFPFYIFDGASIINVYRSAS